MSGLMSSAHRGTSPPLMAAAPSARASIGAHAELTRLFWAYAAMLAAIVVALQHG